MRSLLVVVVLFVAMAAVAIAAQAVPEQQSAREPLARQVATNLTLKLPAGSCTVPQTAALIARQLDIPSGIEQLPGPCASPGAPMTDEIALIGMDVHDVLDLLVKTDPRYYWVYSDVVVVRPLEAWNKKDHFLHDTLQAVELKEQNIGAAMDQIFAHPRVSAGGGELIMSADPTH